MQANILNNLAGKVERLAIEAEKSNPPVAVVLYSLIGAMNVERESVLAAIVRDFSKAELERMDDMRTLDAEVFE